MKQALTGIVAIVLFAGAMYVTSRTTETARASHYSSPYADEYQTSRDYVERMPRPLFFNDSSGLRVPSNWGRERKLADVRERSNEAHYTSSGSSRCYLNDCTGLRVPSDWGREKKFYEARRASDAQDASWNHYMSMSRSHYYDYDERYYAPTYSYNTYRHEYAHPYSYQYDDHYWDDAYDDRYSYGGEY